MPKGALEQNRVETGLAQLRDQIRDIELGITSLKGRGGDVLRLLSLRDAIEDELVRREELGQDMRAERSRMDTVDNQIQRQAVAIMSELSRSGGLGAARQELDPPEEHWWWYLDLGVHERRRVSAKRMVITIVSVLVVVIGGGWLIDHFWGPEPGERAASGYTSQAEQFVYSGDYAQAIPLYEQALEAWPQEDDARVRLAVLYDITGDEQQAEQLFEQAQANIADEERYLLTVARAYQAAGLFDTALEYAEQALALDANSPEAVFIRGGIYESMGENQLAINDFEQAADLAADQGEDALYVLARTRMGMLMQSSPAQGLGGF